MATRFYLTRALASTPMPVAKQSADTIDKDYATVFATYAAPGLMSTTQGTQNTDQSATGKEEGEAHYTHFGTWVSPPLPEQTISGTVTIGLAMSESDISLNMYPRVKIYLWKANNTFGSDILALTTSATEVTVDGTANVVFFNAVAITETDIESGDKICIELETYDDNTLGAGDADFTQILRFGGTQEYPGTTYYLSQHGIIADGSDETAALVAAFADAVANSYSIIAFPQAGTIGVDLTVECPDDVELVGNDCTIKLIDSSDVGEDEPFFIIHEGCNVHDLIFDGNMDEQIESTNGVAIYDDSTIHNCEIKNVGSYSLYYWGDDITISTNYIHDTGQYGISCGGTSTNISIIHNTFDNCTEIAIKLKTTTTVLVEDNNITVNTSSEPYPVGIACSADNSTDYVTINENTINASGTGAIAIGTWVAEGVTHTNVAITDNLVTHATVFGIYLQSDSGTITGNDITYAGTCIDDNGSGNTVSGNTCTPE